MKYRSLSVAVAVLISLEMTVAATAQEAPAPYITRGVARHVAGSGVGHSNSFTSVDWLLPLSAGSDTTMWFGDFRGLLFNDGEFGGNFGSGYRWYAPAEDRIYGINAYWDVRQDDGLLFNQLGLGVETLGQHLDFRINGYTPAVNDANQVRALQFTGNQLLRKSTIALSGVDVEVGVNLPPIADIYPRLLSGVYYFDASDVRAAGGYRARIEAAFRDDVAVNVAVQDDDLFGSTLTVAVELRDIFRHEQDLAPRSMDHKFRRRNGGGDGRTVLHRLGDQVYRQQNIVLTHRTDTVRDPGGNPLTFIHVVEGGGPVAGTFEDPYGSFAAAMADPLAGNSIVYTPFGGTFNENVTLVPGTRVLSNGPAQTVATDRGPITLPFSGVSPALTALPSTINGNVALADMTTFSGFDVMGGISGNGITNSTIANNRIRSAPADALSLTGLSSGVTIDNLLITTPTGRGLSIVDSSATVSGVTVQNAGGDGIEVSNSAAANQTVSISGSTVTDAMGEGLDINLNGPGDLLVNVSSSTISSVNDAVNATTTGGSTGDLTLGFSSLTARSVTGTGFDLNGSAGGGTLFVSSFSGNSVTQAAAGGVLADTVTFDADPLTAGIQQVSASTLQIGSTTTAVNGNGLSLINADGSLNTGTLTIVNNSGTGLFVNNSPLLTLSSGNTSAITSNLGPVLDLTTVNSALMFRTLSSENSPGNAIHLDDITGTITSSTTTLVDSVNPAILIENIALPDTLAPNFGALTIESLIGNSEAANITTAGVVNGLTTPVYNTLTIIFP